LDNTLDPDFYKYEEKFTSLKPRKNYGEVVFDLMFSSAHAGMLSSMGISKQKVVDFIKVQAPIFANALDTQLSAPIWRSVAWNALGTLIGESLGTTDTMLLKIQSDIDRIQAILNATEAHIGVGDKGLLGYDVSKNYVGGDNKFAALTCTSSNVNGACIPVSKSMQAIPGTIELPIYTQGLTAKVAKMGDGLNSATTLASGALSSAKEVNKNASAIRAELLKKQKNLEKILNRNGTTIDLVKETNKFTNQLRDITKKGLIANNTSAEEMRSMMSGGSNVVGKIPNIVKGAVKKTATGKDVAVVDPTKDLKKLDVDGAAGDIEAAKAPVADNLSDTEKAMQAAAEVQAKNASSSIDAANTKNTINEDNGYSLFEVITNRYQKSAYPRLFKK
jgi:hypothetical protein